MTDSGGGQPYYVARVQFFFFPVIPAGRCFMSTERSGKVMSKVCDMGRNGKTAKKAVLMVGNRPRKRCGWWETGQENGVNGGETAKKAVRLDKMREEAL